MTREQILSTLPTDSKFWEELNYGFTEHCGIVTNDREKAEYALNALYKIHGDNVLRYEKSKYTLRLILKSGGVYQWIKPTDNARGYRLRSVIIDSEIDEEIFFNVILPSTRCGKNDVRFVEDFIGEDKE